MKRIDLKTSLWGLLLILICIGCQDDDNKKPIVDDKADTALFVMTDPKAFSGVIIPNKGMFTGTNDPATAEGALELSQVRNAGIFYGKDIYHPSNQNGDVGVTRYSFNDEKELFENGFIAVSEKRFMFEIVSETKGYYTDGGRSTTAIQTFNPTTMQRTGEIDITTEMKPYMTDKVKRTRIGSFMVESKGKLYTQVFFFDEKGLHAYDKSFVAVFDTKSDKFLGFAIHDDYIWLGFERKNSNYIGKAENGDLYLSGIFGNIEDGAHSKCLRIKAGETEFDPNWKLDYNKIINNTNSFTMGGPAVLNGKLYIRLKASPMAADFGNSAEEDVYAYEIDITSKIASKIEGIPGSGAAALFSPNGPVVIDGKVYYAVSGKNIQAYYVYNPKTNKSEKAFSLSGGIPTQLISMK